jgi:ADP-L-glycero-D-manno-heptose 6-epimerase
MYIVTGAAGFIGNNLVRELNRREITNILCVDNLADQQKQKNMGAIQFVDYLDKHEFRRALTSASLGLHRVNGIFHQGACTDTLLDDGVYMMDNNFTYSKALLNYAIRMCCPFVYASSAAVYGLGGPGRFAPIPANERPANVYALSKLTFDNYVRNAFARGAVPMSVVGLRYFNVYGPHDEHKGRMASVIRQFARQIRETGKVKVFGASGGYENGEQRRDFVFVRDIVNINLYCAQVGEYADKGSRTYQAIVNAGSGRSRSFNDVVRILMKVQGESSIEYIPLPQGLEERFQCFTEADVSGLRALGYDLKFTELEDGIVETFRDQESMAQPGQKPSLAYA